MKNSFLVACMVFLGTTGRAAAIVTPYYNEGDFQAANAIVSIETFDSYAPASLGDVTTIGEVTYETEPNPWGPSWMIGPHLGPGYVSPPNDFGSGWLDWDKMHFGPGRYVHAMGFWMITGSLSPTPAWEIIVEETTGSTELFEVSFTNGVRYYGFSSDVGIAQITVRDDPDITAAFNWSYDNIAHSQVLPEPATVGLLAVSAMALLRRRN